MVEAANTGMPKAEMKKLLTRSKAEPVNCAVGVGGLDQNVGLMFATSHQGRTRPVPRC